MIMICKAIKKTGDKCEQPAQYGVLCRRHSQQVSETPAGFQKRRVVRNHLFNLTSQEIDDSEIGFRKEKGDTVRHSSNALSYRVNAIEFMLENGEVTATQLMSYLDSISPYEMTAPKIGQLVRMMKQEGTVVRRQTSRKGRSCVLYAINEDSR